MRSSRVEHEKERRHRELRASALAAGKGPRKRRRFGLRLMLLPVAFVLLLTQWPRPGDRGGLVLSWSGGEVRAAGEMLSSDRPEVELAGGEWCLTRGNARARIAGETCSIELGLATQLLVEDPARRRVRLQQGEVTASGDCTVSSPFGVLDLAGGTATLRLSGRGFEVESRSGEPVWVGPTGRRPIAAGSRIEG